MARDTPVDLAAAGNEFGFRMLSVLAGSAGNLLISPVSAHLALGMAAQGARGETWRAMARALGLERMRPEAAREAAARLSTELATGAEGVQLELANSCWVNQGFELLPEFAVAMRACYAAELANLDFGSPEAPAVVNRWTSDRTHGRVPGIVERLDARDVLCLLNATYFRGDWAEPFPAERTEERPFTTGEGRPVVAPLMARHGTFAYAEDGDLQAVSLPYLGGRFHLVVVLPRAVVAPAEFGRFATAGWWGGLVERLSQREGDLLLPRLRFDVEMDLREPLGRLGMGPAFAPGADFSGLSAACERKCFLSDVRQRAVIELDEAGTTAAAVTIVSVRMLSFGTAPALPFRMVVDRPFLFALADRATGALLFLGVCEDPTRR